MDPIEVHSANRAFQGTIHLFTATNPWTKPSIR